MRRAGALPLALVVAALAALPAGSADLRRLESVGVFPIQPAAARQHAPRDGAVRAAVSRGVERAARDLLPEGWEQAAEPAPKEADPADLDPRLAVALGSDPFEYATRFRILEDRGVRKALFTKDPEVESEYVVMVEVFVDAGRVRERLHVAGFIEAPAGQDSASRIVLVLENLGSYAAYDALRRTLIDELEVSSALPIEMSPGRAVLAVEGPYGADSLLQALLERADTGLRVVPLDREGQTLTLLVDFSPPPADLGPADAAEPLDPDAVTD